MSRLKKDKALNWEKFSQTASASLRVGDLANEVELYKVDGEWRMSPPVRTGVVERIDGQTAFLKGGRRGYPLGGVALTVEKMLTLVPANREEAFLDAEVIAGKDRHYYSGPDQVEVSLNHSGGFMRVVADKHGVSVDWIDANGDQTRPTLFIPVSPGEDAIQ